VTRRASRRVALALLALAVAACGKKGPPVAPELRLPVPPTGLQASVDEDAIVVSWTNPTRRIDGTSLKDLAEVKLFRHEDDGEGPLKPAMLSGKRIAGYDQLAAIRLDAPAPATISGTSARWVDRQGLILGHRYVYVLTALDAQGRSSPPSERRPITLLAAPMPPRDVQATGGNHEVTLTWRPPAEFTDGSPAGGDLRYIVLRGVGSAGPVTAIAGAPLQATSYTETGLENEADYRYAIRAVRVDPRATVTGAPSEAIVVRTVETARPTPPKNLVAVPSSGAFRLAWSASPEANVALYAIYRATGSEAPVRIATTPSGTTTYTDRDTRRGVTYRYTVTAIDNARQPNESAPSNTVAVTLP
jgi:predicted small lipoprotein YifL